MSGDAKPATCKAVSFWAGILENDERLLWQGRPGSARMPEWNDWLQAMLGMALLVVGTYSVSVAFMGGVYIVLLIGYAVAMSGLVMIWAALFRDAAIRRNSWYFLTNRRAFILLRGMNGKRALRAFPLTARLPVTLQEGPPGSVWFMDDPAQSPLAQGRGQWAGFRHIPDAPQIFNLISRIQRGQA